MRTYSTPRAMQRVAERWRAEGHRIGVVPTMGALHAGHLSLVRRARRECDRVILTLFVNPRQFAPNEDLSSYPHTLAADTRAASQLGVDALFMPDTAAMYPEGFQTAVRLERISAGFEGARRPTHFDGVTTVVAKLYNITRAHRAYFGQKDAQQAALVTQLAEDLNFGVKVVVCPIVRERDGLAMSSRNVYLSAGQRAQAPCLHQALQEAKRLVSEGETHATPVLRRMRQVMKRAPLAALDYAGIVDRHTFARLDRIDRPALAVIAARFGTTRLLDNMILQLPQTRRAAPRARDRKG